MAKELNMLLPVCSHDLVCVPQESALLIMACKCTLLSRFVFHCCSDMV